MYAIANVIYGLPFPPDLPEEVNDRLNEVSEIEAELGPCYLAYYSGSDTQQPRAFGVLLCEFDECQDVNIADLVLVPTQNQIDKFNNEYAKLDPEFKELLKDQGEPRVFILWSTS